jgi:hypothetical protein
MAGRATARNKEIIQQNAREPKQVELIQRDMHAVAYYSSTVAQ